MYAMKDGMAAAVELHIEPVSNAYKPPTRCFASWLEPIPCEKFAAGYRRQWVNCPILGGLHHIYSRL
jgi:hypothetical protein